jgi:hypothetical protein
VAEFPRQQTGMSLLDELYLIGRGETPMARASSAGRRRDMTDPTRRAAILARLKAGRETAHAKANWEKSHPRKNGRWLKMKRKRGKDASRKVWRHKVADASKKRWQDPLWREKALMRLAQARAQRKR